MKALRLQIWVFLLVSLMTTLALGQAANDYRTAATGNWNATVTWERYSGSQWEPAAASPDSAAGAVSIQSGHTVTVTADVAVDSVTVLAGGQVVVNSGVIVTIGPNNGAVGIDVDSTGTLTVNGTILCQGRLSGEDTGIIFADGSTYDHARNAGSVPISTWQTGSTLRLSGTTSTSPTNMSQDFYNIVINCPSLAANVHMRMTGNTVRGDIIVLATGPSNRYYLTAPDVYADPITILGDVRVFGGIFSTNGSGTADSIVVRTYGNVIVTGGNFGCSRGSGPSVSWLLYGDSMVVSNATLQNSTSGDTKIQRWIFSKQGTTYLRWNNVTYGTGTSPITLQVAAGTTLDIGTTQISSSNTGSFILDSGATVVSMHNAPGNEGSIECLGDYGGGAGIYNAFVNVNSTAGNGVTSVTGYKGPHPGISDPTKALQRWWRITADPGITQATLTMYYHDYKLGPTDTDVRGTEVSYKALRYPGTGTSWFIESGSVVDADFDFVTTTGVTTVAGEWTAGEESATDVTSDLEGIPETFYVDQNFPNPFNPSTTIAFGLPRTDRVTVKVYDILGREVATVLEGEKPAGVHRVTFDARGFSSGAYVYRVQAGSTVIVRQMMLLK